MKQPVTPLLRQILQALDAAIESAMHSPELAGGASLAEAEALCRKLTETPITQYTDDLAHGPEAREVPALLWQIRSRAGRLRLLLDATDAFYRGLFSPCASKTGYAAAESWASQPETGRVRVAG